METFGIAGRPDYPPLPVGLAIREPGQTARYYGFGHVEPDRPDGWEWNNAEASDALAALRRAWANPDGILMHNAKFDLDVIETHFGLAPPPWDKVHDTMFLAFLHDPNENGLGLKFLAHRHLNMPPEERDALSDWLVKHQPVPGVKIGTSPRGKEPPGKYIAHAPTEIVGPYAIGDVDRTWALFAHLWTLVVPLGGMAEAYDRERRLVPVLMDMERRGIAIDVDALAADIVTYSGILIRLEQWTRSYLGATPDLNLNSGDQLMTALRDAGKLDMHLVGVTPETGKMKSDKETLEAAVADERLAAVLRYSGVLRTALSTFMKPWLETAKRSNGLIYTTWHQTRGAGGGARTGRLSSSPNFQNIPKEFDNLFEKVAPPFELPDPPMCRRYIKAYPGQVLAGRDFASQELRILAHFEDGVMLNAFRNDPTVDLHAYAANLITDTTGLHVTRQAAKTLGFAIIYGAGIGRVARGLKCSYDEARQFYDAYLDAFPGIEGLRERLNGNARSDKPIWTLGCRPFKCEDPRFIEGVGCRNYEYKMINTLVQGSAADQTKQAMIDFHERAGPGKLLLTVHDELVFSTPPEQLDADMEILRDVMDATEALGLDTPMRSDGEVGDNWASMEKAA
jgi:DNA polymerase-1